ncbi:TPA: hypothetical protein JBF89_13145 [Legionella pneumophila]|nr:hypothetical protein [Legionella pneumophila]HAU0349910.1 hypothetical protein [Legionella pneumophila]HAU0353401.1 hypothetical protein [Legionella pneumophila]HAU0359490.1 hypothetical protein [Legionella pneumophila]HAU0368047.1 hypothetical protein [Legionella pneumophila]
MYQKNTVFILGAGASYNYGYPLGNALILEMLKSLEDLIPIPCLDANKNGIYYNSNDQKNGVVYPFERIKDFLIRKKDLLLADGLRFEKESGQERLRSFPVCFSDRYTPDNLYYEVKICDIEYFRALKEKLIWCNPVSIDAFLRNNPHHEEAAKTLIIYTLLKCENSSFFDLDPAENRTKDYWQPVLFNELTQGCWEKPDLFLENRIDFVTFNYDTSLEYGLKRLIQATQRFSAANVAENPYISFISKRIHHVYGSIYSNKDYGFYSNNEKNHDKKRVLDFQRFLTSLFNYKAILTISEERAEQTRKDIQELIKNAEIINIIGFAFDPDNLDILGFPNSNDGWQEYIERLLSKSSHRKINYLNFDGENSRISTEFEIIKTLYLKQRPITIRESRANKIKNALLYDFKSFLIDD